MDLVSGKVRGGAADGFCFLNVSLYNTFCFLTPFRFQGSMKGDH